MKKFIAITLMAIMLVAVASTASAVSVNNPTTFSIYVNSKDSSAAYTDEENETRKTSSVRAIYVKHWVTGGRPNILTILEEERRLPIMGLGLTVEQNGVP